MTDLRIAESVGFTQATAFAICVQKVAESTGQGIRCRRELPLPTERPEAGAVGSGRSLLPRAGHAFANRSK